MVARDSQPTRNGIAFLLLLFVVLGTFLFLYSAANQTRTMVAKDQLRLVHLADAVAFVGYLPADATNTLLLLVDAFELEWKGFSHSPSVKALIVLGLIKTPDLNLLVTEWNRGHPTPAFHALMKQLETQFDGFVEGQSLAFTLLELGLLIVLISLSAFSVFWLREEARRRARFEELQKVYRLSLAGLEADRQRIALDLHDTLAQELAGTKMLLSRLGPGDNKAPLLEGLERAQNQVRGLARGLRPPALDLVGFRQAVVDLLDEFGQRTSLTVRTELDSNLGSGLAAGSDIHVYRIVQEALQNVWKHSRAKTVRVSGSQTSVRLVVQVTDDGVGVLPGSDSEASLGMSGMRERAALLGGSFDWKSSSDGVVVTLEVPLESPDR